MTTKIRLVYNRIPELRARFPAEVDRIVQDAAKQVEREAKNSMARPKHGRTYRRGAITRNYKPGGPGLKGMAGMGLKGTFSGGRVKVVTGYTFHRASAPGEAPAIDTGNLVNSIRSEKVGSGRARVVADAEYAAALEFGSVHVAPRPFLRPAVEKVKAWFINALMGLERRLR